MSSRALPSSASLTRTALPGAVILCALPETKLPPFFAHALVGKSLTLAGSLIGGTSELAELFDLAAKHDIKAWVETRPMSQATQVRLTW